MTNANTTKATDKDGKHSKPVDCGQSYDDLIQIALDGVREIQNKTPEELRQWVARQPPFPPTIPTSGNQVLFITPEGYSALRKLGRTWQKNDQRPGLLSQTAAERLAIDAFGQLLDSHPGVFEFENAKARLIGILATQLQSRLQPIHFYFAARVFEQPEPSTFHIGPVTFYRRNDWLDMVERTQGFRVSWKKRALDQWANRTTRLTRSLNSLADWLSGKILMRWPKSPLAHKIYQLGADRRYANDVLKAVGPCEWIIAVEVRGRDHSRAAESASVAATVALDTLGLPMPRSAALNLRGPGQDVNPRFQREMFQLDNQYLGLSVSIDWPRVGGTPGSHARLITNMAQLGDAAGRAIASFLSVEKTKNAELMRRWVEAMYWFGQARRERTEFIALVKFGIALDVLAKGGKKEGILKLTQAILGKSGDDVIASNNRKLKDVVEILYNDGRSQIAHGGKLALLHDLPIELDLADRLTAHVLAGYVVHATDYDGVDEYENFFAAIPTLRLAYMQSSKVG